MKLIQLLLYLVGLQNALGGNYLFWLPYSSRSIKIGFMPMARELAKRGHTVRMVSPYKERVATEGIIDINQFSAMDQIVESFSDTLLEENSSGVDNVPFSALVDVSLDANRAALTHPEVQKLLNDADMKIDVVMTMSVLANEACYFIADKKNASLVHWASMPFIIPWYALGLGAPVNPSYMPNPLLPYTQYMNFQERFKNTVATVGFLLYRKFYILPKVESLLGELFPNESKIDLAEFANTAALGINLGSPFLGDGLRPVLPNFVQGSLMGCRAASSDLEGDLKKWVEGAENGVIYVSFGSMLKASRMSEERRKSMLQVFSQLKQRIVWKWDIEMPEAPANVKVFPWLPQTDLLGHPNVKLFVTHGGAGSIQETMCHKVPIVGIPVYGDQMNNVDQAVLNHLGIAVRWKELREDNLLDAITTVLKDPSYKASVDQLHDLILDQPQHPLDKAVWWLEYLLRHPKNLGMRSPAHDLNIVQYVLLDVIAVILLIVCLVFYLIKKLYKICRRRTLKQKSE